MDLPSDLIDLLVAFADAQVEYLLIRGQAVALHGVPRFTKDALFRAWWEVLSTSEFDFWQVPFDAADPVNTPRGLRLDDEEVVSAARIALGYALTMLEQLGVDYAKPWGTLQVAVRGDERIPMHGGDGDQIYNAIWSGPIGDGQLDVYYGSSALTVVSFENEWIDLPFREADIRADASYSKRVVSEN